MIPTIGMMVGLYICTRMLEVLTRPREQRRGVVQAVAAITLAVALLGTFDLLMRGLSGNSPSFP